MKKMANKNSKENEEADLMRRKAENYLVCFIDGCPLHETCLRWVVGQYVDQGLVSHISVNPRNPRMGGEGCPMFRDSVRSELIAYFGRRRYFLMRRGDKFIYPADQQVIEQTCRRHGWMAPLVYDGEEEDWQW